MSSRAMMGTRCILEHGVAWRRRAPRSVVSTWHCSACRGTARPTTPALQREQESTPAEARK
eukprot:3655488-Pyramimonas_sp.AAC.1